MLIVVVHVPVHVCMYMYMHVCVMCKWAVCTCKCCNAVTFVVAINPLIIQVKTVEIQVTD